MQKLRKITLIRPPLGGNKYGDLSMPAGLLSLASSIKQGGYLPNIVDFALFGRSMNNPSDIFRKSAEKILSRHPQVLGFSVMCNNLAAALLIAKECKKMEPDLPIIFGGPGISFDEVEVLKEFGQVDIIVRGEGEITLLEVLQTLETEKPLSDVLGITYREEGQVVRNPDRPFIEDLDQLPFLDYSLLPDFNLYAPFLEAGRGCPFSCTFCSTCKTWKRNFRMKSPRRLAEELRNIFNLFKGKNHVVTILHDHFLASRKKLDEFLGYEQDQNVRWTCSSRLEVLDEPLIERLKQAGCCSIFLGIESGSYEMQKETKKNLPLSKLSQVLVALCKNQIATMLSFIIGFPSETEAQINQTLLVALCSRLSGPMVDIAIHPLTFLKGSELYAKALEKGAGHKFYETTASPLATGLEAELSMIKKYPHIFPSFYYVGRAKVDPGISQKMALLFMFLIESYARPLFALLKHLEISPFQLGLKLISFFDAEGIDWSPSQGFYFPQYVEPLKKFVRLHANPLLDQFSRRDEKVELLMRMVEKRKKRIQRGQAVGSLVKKLQ
jgi:radical SAM superfamily enzyme YgiQ (UPF0313 family)